MQSQLVKAVEDLSSNIPYLLFPEALFSVPSPSPSLAQRNMKGEGSARMGEDLVAPMLVVAEEMEMEPWRLTPPLAISPPPHQREVEKSEEEAAAVNSRRRRWSRASGLGKEEPCGGVIAW
jgi:hypothetical protein